MPEATTAGLLLEAVAVALAPLAKTLQIACVQIGGWWARYQEAVDAAKFRQAFPESADVGDGGAVTPRG